MHTFTPDEAKRVFDYGSAVERRSGLGDVAFKVETVDGRTEVGQIIEVDGEDSRDGVLLGGMPPDGEQRYVRFDEMVWIGVGYLE